MVLTEQSVGRVASRQIIFKTHFHKISHLSIKLFLFSTLLLITIYLSKKPHELIAHKQLYKSPNQLFKAYPNWTQMQKGTPTVKFFTQKKDPRFLSSLLINSGSICFPGPSPAKYHRRCRLYFRIRNGNGCCPTTISTRKFHAFRRTTYKFFLWLNVYIF